MLTLYINNKLADISDGTLITVTKTYESISNPTLYYADYSKTVKLPISKRNNEIFSNFNRLDSVVTNVSIDPTKKIPFFILSNQEQVMEGYLRLDNANTIYTDEAYEVTLFSTLGLVMNELKLLTFNKNAVDVDPRYVIDSPINDDLIIDRNLVKQSFMQQGHQLNSDNITDWIGFIPTYQGKYSNFSSDKEQIFTEGRTDDLPREYDEHYRREFRSYYQQPYIWIDKLWKVAKDKIEAITDFTINLDKSWFTVSNPYYKDLIYTCPSLFNSDDTFKSANQSFESTINVEMFNKPERSSHPLTEHNQIHVKNLVPINQTDLYNPTTGIFNSNGDMGGTMFKGRFRTTLYASPAASWSDSKWGKIRKDNPFYVKVKAVRASDGTQITGAYKTFLLYSCDYSVSSSTFDEAIEMGLCDRTDPVVTVPISSRPRFDGQGYHVKNDAHYWEAWLDFSINVTENVPYKMVIEIWNPNNGCPFEYSSGIAGQDWVPRWDWLWVDFFNTSGSYDHGYSFYFDSINITDCTAENMRSFSDVSLYRIFPKDVTLCDVLLNYSKMFGLVWTVDNLNKEINIMTRNRFFSDYHIEDWSNKIDRSKEFKFNPLNFDKKYVTFNFEEGKCGRLENYENMYQYTYGTKKLDTGYDFNADENKLFTKLQPSVVAQKKQYSQMYNTTNPLGANFMGYNYMIYPEERYVDNDKDGSNAGMSGAFYFHNGVFTPDSRLSLPPSAGEGYYVFVTDDTTHQIQTGEYCWNMCGENMTKCYALPNISTISRNYDGKRYSVHFEKPKEYFFETPQGQQKYIYNSYWENYINERYCSQNKKLTAYVYLSVEDFARIDFREFIKIDNILYHIDKIYDYNFNTEEPVKMDLVQVWDLSAYTEGQLDFPYLFTEEENYVVSTTSQTIKVYASENWCVLNHSTLAPPHWIAVENVGDNTLRIKATSETDTYREGQITLSLGADGGSYMTANRLWYTFTVVQYPNVQYRLDTDYHTVVFDGNGGTQTLNIDCTDVSNGAITIQSDTQWLSAEIAEYSQTRTYRSRISLHLNITALPNTVTRGRSGRITLSATMGGMSYQTIVNVGQQGGFYTPRIINTDIITDEYGLEEGLSVLDGNNNAVNYLLSNQTYHFTDLFPEEIDINSLRISQGTVSITGNAGEQTVTFTPQLANGDDVGGGVITAKTLNGIDVTYNYNVYETAPTPPTPETTYFYVEDISGSNNTLSIVKYAASSPTIEVFYSTDQQNWSSMGTTSTTAITATVPANGKLYLKATADSWSTIGYENTINCSGNFNVGGNIMSLLYGDNFQNQTTFPTGSDRNFRRLFYNSTTIVNTEDLILPATTMTNSCYGYIFSGCTSLTTAPELPATTLANNCYAGMFSGCTSLTTAPATLPATTLANYCYTYMFRGCTGLTTTPALPATTLASNCYSSMFGGCTSLTAAPVLPAKTLAIACYYGMFNGCTNLNEVTTYADDISASNCLNYWLNNVAASGDFYNLGSATYIVDSASGIPTGWTEHTSITPVPPPTPTPVVKNTRYVVVKSTDGGLFRIAINGDITKTTDYYENKLLDNTIVKMSAIAKDGKKFVCWKNTVGAVLTTPTITFTVSSALLDSDGIIMYYPEFADGELTATLTVNAGTNGYLTIGSDSTHYTQIIRTVPIGTTITNIRCTSTSAVTRPFSMWSDGSTVNPRDFVVSKNITVTAVYGGTLNRSTVELDGTGLLGADDLVVLGLNGSDVLKVGIGESDNTNIPDSSSDLYDVALTCYINDEKSKFNKFIFGANNIYDNPYIASSYRFNGNTVIKVETIKSALYYTEDSAQDYFSDLHTTQDWLLDDNIFKPVEIMNSEETKFECQQYGKLTIAIPKDYNIEYIMNDLGEDITGEFTIEETDNGSWWLLYNADTREAAAMVFMLNLV